MNKDYNMKSPKILCINEFEINKKKKARITEYIDEAILHFNKKYFQVNNMLNEMRNDFLKQMNIIVTSFDKKIEFVTSHDTKHTNGPNKEFSESKNCEKGSKYELMTIAKSGNLNRDKSNSIGLYASKIDRNLLLISKITQDFQEKQLPLRHNLKYATENGTKSETRANNDLHCKSSQSFIETKTSPNEFTLTQCNNIIPLKNDPQTKSVTNAFSVLLESK